MDATLKLSKNTALFLVTALMGLTAGAAQAQSLVSDQASVTLTNTQGAQLNITSTGAAITYTVTKPVWVNVTGGTTTPATLFVQINTGCTAAICPDGNITLTPTSPTGLTALNIPVSFNASGGGSGTINADRTSVPFTISNGSSSSTTVSITTSGSPVNISTVTSPASWLSCFLSATQVSTGSPATLTIQVSGVNFPNSTQYSACTVTPSSGAALTINVSMSVGTSASGSFSFNQNNLSFSYPCGTCTAFVQVNSSATNTYYTSVNSTNGWLSSSGNTANSGNGVSLSVNGSIAAALPTGNYQGTVLLTNSGNSADQATITVNLSVNGGTGSGIFNPSSLSFTASLGGAAQSQTVTINSGTLTSATNGGCSWVGVSQPATNQLLVQVFPASLFSANTYTCSVTATISGTTYTLPVTLVLGSSGGGGGGTGGVVAPTSLTFTSQFGAANVPTFQQVTVTGSGTISVSTTYGTGTQAFISASGSAAAPGTVTAFVSSGLPVGTYSGTLNITVNGNTQQVPVTYNVTSGAAVLSNPGSINVNSNNGSSIAPIQLSLTASDNSSLPVTVQSSASWVTVTGAGSSTPANFTVNINPASLVNGINTATLTVNASGASNNPMTIPVVVLVNGSTAGGSGNLTLSTSTLTYNTSINGGSPASQQLTVSSATSAQVSFSSSASTSNCGGNWITISPSGTLTTPQTLTVTVSAPTNVSTATQCSGSISLVSGGLTQTVQVVENIGNTGGGGGGSGNITATPASLSFSYQVGSTNTPGVQAIDVASASGASGIGISITTTTTTGGNWLSAGGISSTTTPVRLTISVNVTGLDAGTYQGNVRITPLGGTAVDVPVTLTVQSLSVSATPATLSFTYRAGDAAPANQNITVSGVSGLTFSATATSNGNWLSVSPASGTTITGGNTLQVAVNGTGLSAGDYTGTIAVLGTGTATGSTTITVNFKVTAPLPTITKVTNAASYASGSLSAGEVITIFGTNIGPSTLVALTQLEPNGKVGTTLGGVQVLVGGYPAALLYVRNDQVSAIVPYEIASPFLAGPNVVIKYLGQSSNGFPVTQVAAAPGIFTANQSGTGPGAILNGNSSVNMASNPANKGETIQVFLTGEGQTSPPGVSAGVTPPVANTPKPLLSVAVLIDGQPANVTFFGEAPGLVAGVLQVNVQIPANARSGDIPIQVNIGGATTQTGVTVSVR